MLLGYKPSVVILPFNLDLDKPDKINCMNAVNRNIFLILSLMTHNLRYVILYALAMSRARFTHCPRKQKVRKQDEKITGSLSCRLVFIPFFIWLWNGYGRN